MKRDEKIEKNMSKIVQRIIQIRLQKGYNNHEGMAIELGISRVAYGNIESGKTKLSLTRLYQIADILNECPSVFLKKEQDTDTKKCPDCLHYQKNEILYQQRKEVFEEALKSKDETIDNLKQHRDQLIAQSKKLFELSVK
jgi:transcriptional regulator with XRE-family HTH domain